MKNDQNQLNALRLTETAHSVPAAVLGLGDAQPTPAHLVEMQHLVDEAMRDGAFGVSSSLGYLDRRSPV